MSARKPDPVIAAWDRLQAAEKAWVRKYDEQDEAEAKAREAGLRVQRPIIRINGNDCIGIDDARRSARALPRTEAKKAIDTMRTALAAWRQDRRNAGLARFDAAERRADHQWRAAMKAIADTRATSNLGAIVKLQLIEVELRDGHSGFGEAILASAIADLSRIGGRSR